MRPELLDEMIAGLDPMHVPAEYIIKAVFVDHQGIEHTVSGTRLRELIDEGGGVLQGASDARVTLDVRSIKKQMLADIMSTYDEVNRLIAERYKA